MKKNYHGWDLFVEDTLPEMYLNTKKYQQNKMMAEIDNPGANKTQAKYYPAREKFDGGFSLLNGDGDTYFADTDFAYSRAKDKFINNRGWFLPGENPTDTMFAIEKMLKERRGK